MRYSEEPSESAEKSAEKSAELIADELSKRQKQILEYIWGPEYYIAQRKLRLQSD